LGSLHLFHVWFEELISSNGFVVWLTGMCRAAELLYSRFFPLHPLKGPCHKMAIAIPDNLKRASGRSVPYTVINFAFGLKLLTNLENSL